MTGTTPPIDSLQLEAWLRQLEAALNDISVVDRAGIVMELDSRIRDSYGRGGRTLDEILGSLGEPAQVANRYRIERGAQPISVPRSRTPSGAFFKWATIGALGFIGILTLGAAILVTRLFPLVKLDKGENRVKILGGMIDIEGSRLARGIGANFEDSDLRLNFGGRDSRMSRKFEAALPGPVNSVVFTAGSAELEVESGSGRDVKYKCGTRGGPDAAPAFEVSPEKELAMDLSAYDSAKCEIELPPFTAVKVDIADGDVKLEEMRNPVTAKLGNGRIVFEKHLAARYDMKAGVVNGAVIGLSDFEKKQNSGPRAGARELFSADLKVTNGNIRIE